ncbi:hypothetical protein P691DRAFT_821916 [Macrolepiota fuliginosa MF-IS2]|uniref:Uncharacterized protein n=1 Tax=Macrolepiota fuliginosa MF-IS2 TaxID=1400762 RepID=A0A9P5WZ26_9AGAR|nr:hypothetical protein P691DRAFT_821916 [Macrolepiota fuliginosa MF-IS2]
MLFANSSHARSTAYVGPPFLIPSHPVLLLSYLSDCIFALLSAQSNFKSTLEPTSSVFTTSRTADIVCRGHTEWVRHWGSNRN